MVNTVKTVHFPLSFNHFQDIWSALRHLSNHPGDMPFLLQECITATMTCMPLPQQSHDTNNDWRGICGPVVLLANFHQNDTAILCSDGSSAPQADRSIGAIYLIGVDFLDLCFKFRDVGEFGGTIRVREQQQFPSCAEHSLNQNKCLLYCLWGDEYNTKVDMIRRDDCLNTSDWVLQTYCVRSTNQLTMRTAPPLPLFLTRVKTRTLSALCFSTYFSATCTERRVYSA